MHAEVEVSAFFAGSDLPSGARSLRLRDEKDTLRPTGEAVVASVRSREEEDSKMEGGREGGREKSGKSRKIEKVGPFLPSGLRGSEHGSEVDLADFYESDLV
jgi:hypothetical protein